MGPKVLSNARLMGLSILSDTHPQATPGNSEKKSVPRGGAFGKKSVPGGEDFGKYRILRILIFV